LKKKKKKEKKKKKGRTMARFSFVGLAAVAAVLIPQVAAQCSGVSGRYTPKLASGVKHSVLATGLRGPRGIAFDTEGNLLVAEQQGGNLLRIVLKESGDSVCVESSKSLVSGGTVSLCPA
jgi:glucose/arabinose dehydrogenase